MIKLDSEKEQKRNAIRCFVSSPIVLIVDIGGGFCFSLEQLLMTTCVIFHGKATKADVTVMQKQTSY